MSWFCSQCEEVFPDTKPAYGWVCEPWCSGCWEEASGKAFGEPPMPPPVTPRQCRHCKRSMDEGEMCLCRM